MRDIKKETAKIIEESTGLGLSEIEEMLEIPSSEENGDYAFPCFKLAKKFKRAPNLIAAEIAPKISNNALFSKAENVGGYVNMFIKKEIFAGAALTEAVSNERFGGSTAGKGKKVICEFSSPNIAKPFHIGHIRSTVIGNSLYKIFDFLGYDVVRINHIGDYGTQFGKMIAAYRHWGVKEDVEKEPVKTLLSYYVKFHKEAELCPELEEEGRKAFFALENGGKEELGLWKWFREESLKEFRRVYGMLGIEFDSYAGESFYTDKMPAVIEELKEKGLLKKSEGAEIVDLEPWGLTPAVIRKSDGASLYITRDIAALLYRKDTYDFYKCLYVVASQQDLHFKQLFKVVELMGRSWAKDSCVHVPFGMVSLEDGTMSTREGRVVFLEDVLKKSVEKTREIMLEKNVNIDLIDETSKTVGIGAVIFNELSAGRIKDYTFKWDKVLNFDGETGPYVQYTHARAASVIRESGMTAQDIAAPGVDYSYLKSTAAMNLIKLIYEFPAAVENAASLYEPSVITKHIINVAKSYNKFYHDEHILTDNPDERRAKLLLTLAAKNTLKNGLALLGIKAPEKM